MKKALREERVSPVVAMLLAYEFAFGSTTIWTLGTPPLVDSKLDGSELKEKRGSGGSKYRQLCLVLQCKRRQRTQEVGNPALVLVMTDCSSRDRKLDATWKREDNCSSSILQRVREGLALGKSTDHLSIVMEGKLEYIGPDADILADVMVKMVVVVVLVKI